MKKIKIGLDFDGVVAYNPFRVIHAPVVFYKRKILGIKKLKFWVPKTKLQRLWWIIVHESSIFPANGVELLRNLSENPNIEFHLVTSRFHFLKPNLYAWLTKHKLKSLFKSINTNDKDEQPHLFKEKIVNKYNFDYFVEDNLDIVQHLSQKTKTKVFWIYNILESSEKFSYKFPFLRPALERIIHENSI